MAQGFTRRDFIRTVAIAAAGSVCARVAPAATLVGLPRVQNVRRTRATVRWGTRDAGPGAIEYTGDDQQALRASSQVREFLPEETGQRFAWYQHEAVLTKLTPGTPYSYRVTLNGQPLTAAPLQFRTSGTAPFQFLAFGDSGMGTPEQRLLSQRMSALLPDFVLHTGDLVYPTGTYERYESLYFEYYRDLMNAAPMFPCPGNHDYYELNCVPYRALHSLPDDAVPAVDAGRYYSFDWGNAHVVSLDSNDSLFDAAGGRCKMLEWLDRDLSETNKFWRIVVLHHPAYSAGIHSEEEESVLVRRFIVPILEKHRVPLVLNGHEHSYQRSFPIRGAKVVAESEGSIYVTTGGGGATLHPVSSSELIKTAVSIHHFVSCEVNNGKLHLKATTVNGETLDKFTVAPFPVLSDRSVVNAADYSERIAPGSLVSIFGLQLASEDASWTKLPLPKALGGTSVTLNDEPIPILMSSARQLNVQIPYGVRGPCELVIRNGNGSAKLPVDVAATAPALFANAVFHADDSAVGPESPATASEVLTLYATGIGTPEDESPVLVKFARNAPVAATASLVKGVPGLYAIRFRVSGELASAAALQVIAGAAASNVLTVPCSPSARH